MTVPVPSARLSGTFRFGSTTSPAVNVMLFQASAAKSEPTIEAPRAPSSARPASGSTEVTTPAETCVQLARQKSLKLAAMACALRPSASPSVMRPSTATVLVSVKTFWITRPPWRPRRLTAVSRTMLAMATTRPAVTWKSPASNSTTFSPSAGTSTAVNLAKAMATAAMVPVWITVNRVQP
jgi:hypothetical protein